MLSACANGKFNACQTPPFSSVPTLSSFESGYPFASCRAPNESFARSPFWIAPTKMLAFVGSSTPASRAQGCAPVSIWSSAPPIQPLLSSINARLNHWPVQAKRRIASACALPNAVTLFAMADLPAIRRTLPKRGSTYAASAAFMTDSPVCTAAFHSSDP